VVIGEGGSGGALAIGISNKNLIMEHSVYYVASPEACAAILWKSREKAATATEALRITSPELVKYGIMDEIIPEPLGGAHSDPMGAFPAIKEAIMRNYHHYAQLSEEEIKLDRYAKFRALGHYEEFPVIGGQWQQARADRAAAKGVRTKAGTWAASEAEARMIELSADRDEQWEASLEGKDQWLQRPLQPPGLLRSGMLEVAVGMMDAKRIADSDSSAPIQIPPEMNELLAGTPEEADTPLLENGSNGASAHSDLKTESTA